MQIDIVTDGLEFPEGPIAMRDGSLLLVEIRRGTLSRITPQGRRETVAELGGGATARQSDRTARSMSATTAGSNGTMWADC